MKTRAVFIVLAYVFVHSESSAAAYEDVCDQWAKPNFFGIWKEPESTPDADPKLTFYTGNKLPLMKGVAVLHDARSALQAEKTASGSMGPGSVNRP